jgi:hypothetical protein
MSGDSSISTFQHAAARRGREALFFFQAMSPLRQTQWFGNAVKLVRQFRDGAVGDVRVDVREGGMLPSGH